LDLFATPFGSETSSILERAKELMTFLAGRGIRYSDPLLTSPSLQGMGVFKAGETLPDEIITNHATGRAVSLHNCIKADGGWCLIIFAGDVSCPSQIERIHTWAGELNAAQKDPMLKFFGLLDMFLVHCAPWNQINLADFPPIFLPLREVTGRDYDKICLDEGNIYEEAGLDRKSGGIVLVRPDRHIGWVGTLDGFGCLEKYLSRIFEVGVKN
jgi:phenol 2-monooxygenase